jgi:hypothetical protein
LARTVYNLYIILKRPSYPGNLLLTVQKKKSNVPKIEKKKVNNIYSREQKKVGQVLLRNVAKIELSKPGLL